MSKFSSFLVFAFGLILIVATAVTIVKTNFFPEPPPPPEEQIVVPHTDLEPLDVGSREQFMTQLDQLFDTGGLEAIHDYVEKQWVPGRLVRGGIFTTSDMAGGRIIDREVRRCDRQGAALMDKAPILARVSPELHVGRKGHLETWTRIKELQSFYITVWFVGE